MDINLTSGNDTYVETKITDPSDTVFGGSGNDRIVLYQGTSIGGAGADHIERMVTADWWRGVQAAYWDSPAAITVDLAAGWADDGWGTRDTLVNINDVSAGWMGGALAGNANANTFYLGGGAPFTVDGRAGEDRIFLPDFGNSKLADFTITVAIDGKSAVITHAGQAQFSATLANVERFGISGAWNTLYDLASFIKPVDVATQGLLAADGNRWNAGAALGTATSLTYSFVEQAPASGVGAAGFRAFNASERAAVTAILDAAAAVTGLRFTEVSESSAPGQLRFGASAQSATKGVSTLPGVGGDAAGDVWLDLDTLQLLAPGQEGYAVLLHEIGHALGLRHPRNVEKGDNYSAQMMAEHDVTALTVMSQSASTDGLYAANWGAYDIAALRALYGSTPASTGDTVHRLGSTDFQAQRGLVDDGGSDTLDVSAATTGATIDLAPGHLSSVGVTAAGTGAVGNLSLGVDTWIENAVGTRYDDVLLGNVLDNALDGGKGNDWIDGGAGSDTAVFSGARNDYLISTGFGKVFVTARDGGSGFDTLLNTEILQFADQRVTLGVSALGADMALTLDQNTSVSGMLPDPSDQARAQVTYQMERTAGHGSVALAVDGSYTYTPTKGFAALDSFGYTLVDQFGRSNSYNVFLAVRASGALPVGSELDDALGGLASNDTINGEGGNDRIAASAGYDTIDGGSGLDTVSYGGQRSAYAVAQDGARWTVAKPDSQGTDTLANAERLLFADGALALDLDGMAGKAYRLYQAAFDRKPDEGGLGYWLATLDRGASMQGVAGGFLGSAEARAIYGSQPSPQTLITKLYQNVLHRAPDAEGYAYWTKLLSQKLITAEDALLGFSESVENQAAVIGAIAHGIGYTPFG